MLLFFLCVLLFFQLLVHLYATVFSPCITIFKTSGAPVCYCMLLFFLCVVVLSLIGILHGLFFTSMQSDDETDDESDTSDNESMVF